MVNLKQLLYPSTCPICDEVQTQTILGDNRPGICPACEKKVFRVKQPFCLRCGKPLESYALRREYCGDCMKKEHVFTQARGVFVYRGAIVKSMYRFKYSNRRDYAAVFAKEAYESCGAWIERTGVHCMVPIPLHKKRKATRGYNQAALFARELGRLTGIAVNDKLLIRTVNTRPQKELDDTERKNNLKKAFHVTKNIVKLHKVLLIDDIYTTGSTVDAAAEALLRAGVQEIYVLCICIGGGY
ncbi:MAG: ComF family protein [bacterium]|nr:ComF family protein [bacterium]